MSNKVYVLLFSDINLFECKNDIEKYACKRCNNFHTNFFNTLKRHIRRGCRHAAEDVDDVKIDQTSKPQERVVVNSEVAQHFACELCPSIFKKPVYLRKHIKSCHARPEDVHWFKCEHCPNRFKQNASLQRHIMQSHTNPKYIVMFKCEYCPYQTKRRGDLKRHTFRRHSKNEVMQWLKCEQCS